MAAIFLSVDFESLAALPSWLKLALALLSEVGSSHRRASNFLVRDKKVTFTLAWGGIHIAKQCEWRPKSASADGYPAELTARLQRFAQTAAGNMKDFHNVGGRDACARGGIVEVSHFCASRFIVNLSYSINFFIVLEEYSIYIGFFKFSGNIYG